MLGACSHLNMEISSCWKGTFYILVSVATFNLSIANCQSFRRSNFRGSFVHFVGNPFTKLNASVLTKLQVSSLGECTFECINSPECFSVNFGNQAKEGKYICELMNTDRFTQPGKFSISQDFHHYNIKVGQKGNWKELKRSCDLAFLLLFISMSYAFILHPLSGLTQTKMIRSAQCESQQSHKQI